MAQLEADRAERKVPLEIDNRRLEIEMKRVADKEKKWKDQLKLQEHKI